MQEHLFRDKRVVVTGDTGFKGSWLAIWLNSLGARVVGISQPSQGPLDNYTLCGLSAKITHFDLDIRDFEALCAIFQQYRPHMVFHLAAQAVVQRGYREPLETYGTNVMGTVHVLEAIRRTPSVKAAVIVTTDKCYENREWVYGYRENDRLGGRDPYSSSKAACEIAIASYSNSFFNGSGGAAVASARAGNVIGGGDRAENRIVPDCIRALERDEPILLRNPDAVRPWQHVLDPLGGYLRLAGELYEKGSEYAGAWNFGPLSKNMVTVRSLADEIVRAWGRGAVRFHSEEDAFPEAGLLQLDISKAVNRLKWQPKLDFEDTVRYTVDEYRVGGFSSEDIYRQRVKHILEYMER